MRLVIAERTNAKGFPERSVAFWRDRWDVATCLCLPAMNEGPSRDRLDRIMPGDKSIINVLPPDNAVGSWDHKMAQDISLGLRRWLRDTNRAYTHVVTLGRRVSDLFTETAGLDFYTPFYIEGVKAINVPHPSGHNRHWNCLSAEPMAKLELATFFGEPMFTIEALKEALDELRCEQQ